MSPVCIVKEKDYVVYELNILHNNCIYVHVNKFTLVQLKISSHLNKPEKSTLQ